MTGPPPVARLVIRRPDLAEPVLERVVAAVAARADLPLDRLSDAQIAGAALAGAATRELADAELCIEFEFHNGPGAVTMRLGPLPAGAAVRLIEGTAVPGVGAIVERLVDRWSVEPVPEGERLSLAIGGADGGGGP